MGGTYIYVSGINNRGQVVGNGTTNGVTGMHAFVYSAGSLVDLGTLGGTNSYGYGINDNGQVVGAAYTSSGEDDAFLYSSGMMNDLGTLGGAQSAGYGINNVGEVVGGASISGNIEHAFLYRAGTMADLGTLGGFESRAYGINNTGQMVGFGETFGIGEHAFLYSGGTMTDLNDVIDTNSGWNLEIATAINGAGQIIGVGTHPVGLLRAFLLTPLPTLHISPTSSNSVQIQFTAQANTGYLIEYRDSLSGGTWQGPVVLDPIPLVHPVVITDPLPASQPRRFYRVSAS